MKKSVFLTGAKGGYGLALANTYLENGYVVYATARGATTNEELQKLREGQIGTLHLLDLDVTDEEMIHRAVEHVEKHSGKLDVLINNAAAFPRGDECLETIEVDEFLSVLKVNAIAPLVICRAFLSLLKKSENAKIVNVSSAWGSLAFKSDKKHGGNASYYQYCAAKTALNMLTRTLAFELEKDNIAAIVLHPGGVLDAGGGPKTKVEAAQGIYRVIDELTMKDTSKFLTWQGFEFPW